MQVLIVRLSQEVDFSDHSVTNFVTLQLPSGETVQAIVSDEGAKKLMSGTFKPEAAPSPAPPVEYVTRESMSFEVESQPSAETTEAPPVPVNTPTLTLTDLPEPPPGGWTVAQQLQMIKERKAKIADDFKQGRTRGKTVQSDQFGPLVPRTASVELSAASNVDEDGVASL